MDTILAAKKVVVNQSPNLLQQQREEATITGNFHLRNDLMTVAAIAEKEPETGDVFHYFQSL